MDYVETAGIRIAKPLYDFVNSEALPGTSIGSDAFWSGFASLLADLAPRCKSLLEKRDQHPAADRCLAHRQQGQARGHRGLSELPARHRLSGRGTEDRRGRTSNVDPEIASIAGPQLVVPVTNARYALNAANARWGSLYDALYGTDAIPDDDGAERGRSFNKKRAAKVVAKARAVLDAAVPLANGSHADATSYTVQDGSPEGRLHRPEKPRPVCRLSRRGLRADRYPAQAQRPAS